MKKINKALTILVYVIVIIFAFLAISAKFSLFGIQLLVVRSGSMEPEIKTGSLVIDKSRPAYGINDIVTFKDKENPSETVTHRIVGEEKEGDKKLFITKGDANKDPDLAKISQEQIKGKVILSIPYIGYVVSFSRTVPGLIILIVVPATIIIYEEINKIKREISKRKKKK